MVGCWLKLKLSEPAVMSAQFNLILSLILNSKQQIIIPKCLCRESSGLAGYKTAGLSTQAFGDDESVALTGQQ